MKFFSVSQLLLHKWVEGEVQIRRPALRSYAAEGPTLVPAHTAYSTYYFYYFFIQDPLRITTPLSINRPMGQHQMQSIFWSDSSTSKHEESSK